MPDQTTADIINLDARRPVSPPRGHAENVPQGGDFLASQKDNDNNPLPDKCPRWRKKDKPSLSPDGDINPDPSKKVEPAKEGSKPVTLSEYERTATRAQAGRDIERMTSKELVEHYPATHSAWCAMNARASRGAHTVCERWRGRAGFANFLLDLGPKPTEGHSLDRRQNANREYSPGNVKWATKKEQGNNRQRNALVLDPETGKERSLKEACEAWELPYEAAKKRLQRDRDLAATLIFTMLREAGRTLEKKPVRKRHLHPPTDDTPPAAQAQPAGPVRRPPVSDPFQRHFVTNLSSGELNELERQFAANTGTVSRRVLINGEYGERWQTRDRPETRYEMGQRLNRVRWHEVQRDLWWYEDREAAQDLTESEFQDWQKSKAEFAVLSRRKEEAEAGFAQFRADILSRFDTDPDAWGKFMGTKPLGKPPKKAADLADDDREDEDEEDDDYGEDDADRAEPAHTDDAPDREAEAPGTIWGSALPPETYEFDAPEPEPLRTADTAPDRAWPRQRRPMR